MVDVSDVLVDQPIFNNKYCHMFSEDLKALHAMARRLGLGQSSFQEPPKSSWPHYDLSFRKRKLAIKLGAVPVDRYECILVAGRLMNKAVSLETVERIAKLRNLHHYNKVLITGGRDLQQYGLSQELVNSIMHSFHAKYIITSLVHGCAKGVDSAVDIWADANNIDCHRYPVTSEEWNKIGKSAGIRRNTKMLKKQFFDAPIYDKIKMCLSFPGGHGTDNMTNQCIDVNIPVFKVDMNCRKIIHINKRLL